MFVGRLDLLALASIVLEEAGFATAGVNGTEGVQLLLAENEEFVLAVSQVDDVNDFASADASTSEYLAERIGTRTFGAKQWDTYVVLLCQSHSPDSAVTTTALSDLRYDTHLFRRVVRTGVAPSLPSLADALRPFLPLPEEGDENSALEDPLHHLQRLLPSKGVSAEEAGLAIAAFLSGLTDG
jgi:hypothetical protein